MLKDGAIILIRKAGKRLHKAPIAFHVYFSTPGRKMILAALYSPGREPLLGYRRLQDKAPDPLREMRGQIKAARSPGGYSHNMHLVHVQVVQQGNVGFAGGCQT
ncbi:hypothetical protein XYCOK13_19780 [Xylanibacillus composti]|uniref:Uncharacterized protein n=1 Tax=Xylanibacillus composti TaxID=1572762 RepID=A0A8J4M1Z2_9BACL|nr:hypothetical protein XYCOK13_19780 [Xylanibacillus composti]